LLKDHVAQVPLAQAVVPREVTPPEKRYRLFAPAAGSVTVTVEELETMTLCTAPSQTTVVGLGVLPELVIERVAAGAEFNIEHCIGRVTAVLRVVLPSAGP
jgi:hypothetical protein